MFSTIIEEHFVALHLNTPIKTIEKLNEIQEKIDDYIHINSKDIEKFINWTKDYKELISNIQDLNEQIFKLENKSLDLWDFGKFKPSSIIVWPFRFFGASLITIALAPFTLYKKRYSSSDLKRSISQAKSNFELTHENYSEFIEQFSKKNEEFIESIKKDLNNIIKKSVGIIDFKENEYDYTKQIVDVDSLYNLIVNQLVPYYFMVDDVLILHVHDVMNKTTIKNYIKEYLTSSHLEEVFMQSQEIDELREKLENRYKDKNESLKEKNWKTTLDLINAKNKKTS